MKTWNQILFAVLVELWCAVAFAVACQTASPPVGDAALSYASEGSAYVLLHPTNGVYTNDVYTPDTTRTDSVVTDDYGRTCESYWLSCFTLTSNPPQSRCACQDWSFSPTIDEADAGPLTVEDLIVGGASFGTALAFDPGIEVARVTAAGIVTIHEGYTCEDALRMIAHGGAVGVDTVIRGVP